MFSAILQSVSFLSEKQVCATYEDSLYFVFRNEITDVWGVCDAEEYRPRGGFVW